MRRAGTLGKTTRRKSVRRGFTLIELLVVISIIATLMSLILPAIQNAREAARRTQCLNNIRNVTVACMSFASSNPQGHLPSLSYYPPDPTSTSSRPPFIEGRSWVVEILPFMDQQSTFDRWNSDLPWDDTTIGAGGSSNLDLASDLYIEALACPNDDSAFQVPGGLSYVANAGFGSDTTSAISTSQFFGHTFVNAGLDWNSNGTTSGDEEDREISFRTGVFWPNFQNGSLRAICANKCFAPGKIYDGSANTLMLGENLNAGDTNWANPAMNSCGFMFPLNGGPSAPTDADKASLASLLDTPAATKTGTEPFINQKKSGPERSPFLSSNHPGIVVVSFCDGSSKVLSEAIDQLVYTKLITPDMTKIRQLTTGSLQPESPVSADAF